MGGENEPETQTYQSKGVNITSDTFSVPLEQNTPGRKVSCTN